MRTTAIAAAMTAFALAAAFDSSAQITLSATATPFATGDAPRRVRVADMNGDGRPDLVILDQNSNSVTILLASGAAGNFVLGGHYLIGATTPTGIAVADFNGDGRPDIATSNTGSNNVSILLNDGAGAFPSATTTGAAADMSDVVAANFNGGAIDLAVSHRVNGDSQVLIGDGTGGFTAGAILPTFSGTIIPIAAGDFNNDGFMDVFAGDFNNHLGHVYLGAGNGTFGHTSFDLGGGTFALPSAVAVADLNGDGFLDLAIVYQGINSVGIWLGDGTGTFAQAAGSPIAGIGTSPTDIAVGDLDRDGIPDIVVAGGTANNILVLRGTGGGAFAAPVSFAAGTNAFGIFLADVDGDGRLDVVSTSFNSDQVFVRLNTSAVRANSPTAVVATAGPAQISVAFSSPTDAASLPIVDFTATCGGVSATGTGSPIVVTGLTNGTAYTCTVVARNANGTSAASAPSNSATPQALAAVSLASDANPAGVGAPVTFTATVSGSGPTGTMNFKDGGVTIGGCGAVPLVAGTARCTTSFTSAGTHALTADYSGDVANIAATGTLAGGEVVALNASSLRVTTSNATTTLFTPVTYTATVTGTSPTGTIAFSDSPNAPASPVPIPGCGAVTLVAGAAQCTFTYDGTSASTRAGLHFITAAYSGDATNQPATGQLSPAPFEIVDLSPSNTTLSSSASNVLAGESVTITATVGPFLPAGAVTFSDGGTAIAACTNVALVGASVRTATCTTSFISGGNHVITARFGGNGIQASSSGTLAGGINVAAPVTTFTGATATGTGTATISFTGGGPACGFAPQGNGPMESAFFIPVTGHPKSPPSGTAPNVDFPQGLVDFVLLNCTPGSTASFTITYPGTLPAGTQYWKYGPTASNTSPHWYLLPATIAGNVVTFSITDGGLGDDDLAANGTLVDQGGPGVPGPADTHQIPTLSEWALILLALVMGGIGMRRLTRR